MYTGVYIGQSMHITFPQAEMINLDMGDNSTKKSWTFLLMELDFFLVHLFLGQEPAKPAR